MTSLRTLRVALVHDWLTGMRGGEKVLEAFADLFPNAPIYTLLYKEGSVSEKLASRVIHASWLQRLPFAETKYRYYLPLMPTLVERLELEPVDLVLSTSSCVAKGIRPPAGSVHASYVHSPMRYIYDRHGDYFSPRRSNLAARLAMRIFRRYLQEWDIRSADRVHHWIANSTFVSGRIWSLYGRDARVINPPVNADEFQSARREPEDYYLMVSALVPYKNVDVAIDAFRLLDRRLVVAGSGPLLGPLREDCPRNVELRGWVDRAELPGLVAGCRAFLLPNVEDFGIAPVEAMAAGRPVIALGEGGVLDSVRDLDRHRAGELEGSLGSTGLFYRQSTPRALADAILRFEKEERSFRTETMQAWARQFDREHFQERIRAFLESTLSRQTLLRAA